MKVTKGLLMTALITGSVLWGGASVFAEEIEEFSLDPMLITAQRMEKKDLDTPAAVEVYTQEKLKNTGATNLQEALKFGTGLYFQAQGPKGISQGSMASKIIIRGVEKGTLVLVDGVPINQSGRYNLDDIGLENIEKVEVVRGGGAVLYGSEATGGVINIITKGTRKNSIHTAWGNYNMQDHGASVQLGKLGLSYNYTKLGEVDNISDPTTDKAAGNYYNILRSEHNDFNWRYNFNDNLYFTHNYSENNHHYVYRYDGSKRPQNKGADYKNAIHTTQRNMMALHYDKDDFKAVLFFNKRDQQSDNTEAVKKPSTSEFNPNQTTFYSQIRNDKSLGFDTSKRWNLNDNSFLLGASIQKDTLNYINTKKSINDDYKKYIYSIYGQYAWELSKASHLNINARETWTGSATGGTNYSKFIPEIEYLANLNDNDSFYAKVGESFMLPTFAQIFSLDSPNPNPDLKPQKGRHYEVGFKRNINNHAWRLALYNYTIKDSIESHLTPGTTDDYYYTNEDVRNTGVELTWNIDAGNGWNYNWGASYSHPQKRSGKDANGAGYAFESWHDYYGRLQLNGGISYSKEKLSASLNFNYLGKRVRDMASEEKMRPQLLTNLNVAYKPVENSKFYLTIDNILDRQDITSSSASNFYTLGRNFMVGYEYSF